MINLGDLVRDRVTGFEGIAINKQTFIGAQERVGVQPRELKADGAPKKDAGFDSSDLKVIKTRVVKALKPRKPKFKLGDFVKDKFSDAQGHITAHVLFLNGCHKWQFTQQHLNSDNEIIEHLLQEPRLEIVTVAKAVPKAAAGGDYPDISGGR